MLRQWFDLIVDNADGLATILTADQGKPLAEAHGETLYGAVVRRRVRRRGQGPLRRHHPVQRRRQTAAGRPPTAFGLAACFFTRDLGRVRRVGEALEFGAVGIDTGLISYEGAHFGGVKEPCVGREGSRHGTDEFTELKYLCIDGLTHRLSAT